MLTLSRAACPPKGGRAPPAAPFAFFEIPPAEFLFLAEKGLASGSPTAKAVEAARLQSAKPTALRAVVL